MCLILLNAFILADSMMLKNGTKLFHYEYMKV